MEFKKCERCGSFFISEDNVCCNCKPKDKCDFIKLDSFIENNVRFSSIEELSINTGISIKNLNRYLSSDNYNVIAQNFNEKNKIGNISNLN